MPLERWSQKSDLNIYSFCQTTGPPFSHQRACYTSFAYTSVNAGKSSSHTPDILSKYRKIVPRKFGLKYILKIVLNK